MATFDQLRIGDTVYVANIRTLYACYFRIRKIDNVDIGKRYINEHAVSFDIPTYNLNQSEAEFDYPWKSLTDLGAIN